MKILLINKFLYPKGGDAISTLTTGKLLVEKGHEVFYWGMEAPENPEFPYKEYFVSHVDYDKPSGILHQLKLSLNILYSLEARAKIGSLISKVKPDLVHLNNFAHQISPSILDVMKREKIPVVMTMRDYKLVCPAYQMLADGKPCERCKGRKYYFCFLKRCTKKSAAKSMVNAVEMYLHHMILHIYDKIDFYISPSQFMRDMVREMGFKGEVRHLPNFIHADSFRPSYAWENGNIVYFGRLSNEKGLGTLIEASKGLDVEVKIIGDGPLRNSLIFRVKNEKIKNVKFLGYKIGEELHRELRKSMFAVLPSECYENNPRSVMEAFALGKPVIGSRIGGIPELVRDGETGLTFEPGNVENLREKIKYLKENPNKITEMGKNARRFVEENLNPEKHYTELIKTYQRAIDKYKREK